jgi:hypothetical protein
MDRLSIGRIVHIVKKDGKHRPAICIEEWNSGAHGNFQMFDEENIVWKVLIPYSGKCEEDTWHWPERI